MKTKKWLVLLFLLATMSFWQCDKLTSNNHSSGTAQTCEGCHTDLAALNSLAQPPESSGEGSVPG